VSDKRERIVREVGCDHGEFEPHTYQVECPKGVVGCLHDESCRGAERVVLAGEQGWRCVHGNNICKSVTPALKVQSQAATAHHQLCGPTLVIPLDGEPPKGGDTIECPTCGGSGESDTCWHDVPLTERCDDPHPCPTCSGRGWVVSPEAVERGAQAHAEASGFISPPDDGHEAMRAGLCAALGLEDE